MKNNKKVTLFGIDIYGFTMSEMVKIIDDSIKNNKKLYQEDINAAKVVFYHKNKFIKKSIDMSDYRCADGQSIVFASKIFGKILPERIAGIDLMQNLIALSDSKKYKIFLLGSKETIIKALVKKIRNKYGEDIIVGYRNGYFNKDEEQNIIHKINSSGAHMLFIGIGSPYKEEFISRNLNEINVPFIMGVGGSFDVLSGHIKRAPLWMQKYGLEWFYRFLKEPKRMFRKAFIINLKFIYMVFEEKLKINKR